MLTTVESNLVAMLVSEGMFTCPSCHTQQSVNQVALQQHIKQSEVEKHLGVSVWDSFSRIPWSMDSHLSPYNLAGPAFDSPS